MDINKTFERSLAEHIRSNIESYAQQQIEELCQEFQNRLADRLQLAAAKASIEIFHIVSFEMSHNQLLIKVDAEKAQITHTTTKEG